VSSGALVLTYHAVEEGPAPLCLDPALFERHLDCIAAAGLRTVTVSALAEALGRGEPLDELVAITFDDGFASVTSTAWPLLAERGLTATVFCVAGYLGRESDWPTQPRTALRRPLAGPDELAAIAAAGAELGSHGLTHAPLDTDDPALLERELAESRRSLQDALGVAVQTLAWPYGVRSGAAEHAARVAGYAAACAAAPGRVRTGAPLYGLPRVDAHYVRRPALLRAVLRGSPYLGARRVAARARRLLRKDYAAGGTA
jgi:peptidoglycan/xylan/chitin deacetylase (PgdA/CDA1 family)